MTKERKITSSTDISLEQLNKLSIQVSLNGLSFCVLDTVNNTILRSERLIFERSLSPIELELELKILLQKHKLEQSSFVDVTVIHSNGLFNFVPNALFDEKELANYLKLNAKILGNDQLAFDVLAPHDMTNVYVPFMNINNYIFELFGEFEFKHNGTVLVESLLNLAPIQKEAVCYTHIDHKHFEIVVIKNKELILYNCFNYFTQEDFIYYLLFTFEQLKLDTKNTKLRLFGAIEEDQSLFKLIYKYVKEVSIFVPPIHELPNFSNEEQHIDFTLLSTL